MTRKDKIIYLHGYQPAVARLKKLQDEYETVFTQATKIVPTLTGMPSSNVHDDKVLVYVGKLEEISKKIEKTKAKITRIDNEIANLKPFYAYMIRQTDIKRIPIKYVAKELKLSEHAVRVKRNRTIDRMFLKM